MAKQSQGRETDFTVDELAIFQRSIESRIFDFQVEYQNFIASNDFEAEPRVGESLQSAQFYDELEAQINTLK